MRNRVVSVVIALVLATGCSAPSVFVRDVQPLDPPSDCASFLARPTASRLETARSDGFEADAPGYDECRADVDGAVAAARTLSATALLWERVEHRGNLFFDGIVCGKDDATATATNDFEEPIVLWGTVEWQLDRATTAVEMFVSPVIEPRDSWELTATVATDDTVDSCMMQARASIAAAGDLAGSVAVPTEPDDPRASDDPADWLAMVFLWQDLTTSYGSTSTLFDSVEDIHSTDAVDVGEEYSTTATVPADEPEPQPSDIETRFGQTLSICTSTGPLDVEGAVGKITILMYSQISTSGPERRESLGVGAFRQGEDGRWRWLGRAISVETRAIDDDAEPCEGYGR